MSKTYIKVRLIIAMNRLGYFSHCMWLSNLAWTWAISLLGLDEASDMLHPEFGWMWKEL